MQLRPGASDTEEDIIVESRDCQLSVDATSLSQHVRDDGATDPGKVVCRQPVQQAASITASHFQLSEWR